MRNYSKKTLKKRAYGRYYDSIISNEPGLPACVITDEVKKMERQMIFKHSALSYKDVITSLRDNISDPPRLKSSRQDWKFWYFYY